MTRTITISIADWVADAVQARMRETGQKNRSQCIEEQIIKGLQIRPENADAR
jgi:metal-responsive CopG/Arc/MetJ family transcriptional regulator